MSMRKKRQTELGIIAVVVSGIILLAIYLMLAIWGYEQSKRVAALTPQPVIPKDYRPDISHCFHTDEERELWDCIRHVEVES